MAEKSSKAEIVTDEKISVLLCEGGETSSLRPELELLTSSPPSFIPHEGKHEARAWVDICSTSVHLDGQGKAPRLQRSWLSSSV